ncbi:MAG: hypothetical protein KME43_26510 [Myxacorys chilensis ATA2-1-KO14]|nr:hypothetical protein [Myxacorys chilensis ATA2-1-KO14]
MSVAELLLLQINIHAVAPSEKLFQLHGTRKSIAAKTDGHFTTDRFAQKSQI